MAGWIRLSYRERVRMGGGEQVWRDGSHGRYSVPHDALVERNPPPPKKPPGPALQRAALRVSDEKWE